MIYEKDFTTTYTINGHEYTVTAPALFDSNLQCAFLIFHVF